MIDVLFLLFCLGVFTLIGLPFARLIRGMRCPLLLAPTLGYAVSGVAATILYACGCPIQVEFDFLVATGLCLVVMLRRQLISAGRAVLSRPAVGTLHLPLCIALVGALLLLLPKWTGGQQFAIFQGNPDDTGAYLGCAIVYLHQPFDVVKSAAASNCIPADLSVMTHINLVSRPTVVILYAMVGQLAPFNMLGLHYTYLMFFMFCAALALAWFFLNLTASVTRWQTFLSWSAAFAFPVGFWGQYVVDINAWSQVSSIPLLVGLVGLLLFLGRPSGSATDDPTRHLPWGNGLAVALLTAGACYFYPENTVIHLAALGPVFLCLLIWGHRANALQLALAVVLGVCMTVLYWSGTMGFLVRQALFAGSSSDVTWWIWSARFYFGCDGWFDTLEANLRQVWAQTHPGVHNNGAEQLVFARSYIEAFFRQGHNWCLLVGLPFTLLAGFAGIFFLTPLASWPWPLQMLDHVLLAVLVVALAWNGFRTLTRSSVRVNLHGFIGVLLTMAVFLLLRRQIWAAGKAISFAAPYLTILFLCPLFLSTRRWPRRLAAFWLIAQLVLGCVRPIWVSAKNLHHTPTYNVASAAQRTYDFDFRPLANDLRFARTVCLDVPDPLLQHYLVLFLYSRNITFRLAPSVSTRPAPLVVPGEWTLTVESEPGSSGLRRVIAHPPP